MSYGLATQLRPYGVAEDTVDRQLLDYLDDRERDTVVAAGRSVVFAKGDYLLRQGDYTDGLFLIQQGTVESVYRGSSGRELTLAFWSEGDFVGAPCVLGTHRCEWAARAVGRVTCLHLDATTLRRLISESPVFAIALVECLGFKGRCYSRLAQSIASNNVESRIASLLITLAETFGIREGNRLVVGKVKQQDLANMVGATRQSIGLVLRQLQERQVIDVLPTKIVLLDIEYLRRLTAPVD